LKEQKTSSAQTLCEQVGSFVSDLATHWAEVEALSADDDVSGCLSTAMKVYQWHQALNSPAAEATTPSKSTLDEARVPVQRCLLLLCAKERLDLLSADAKGGWGLLSNIMTLLQAEESKKKAEEEVINFECISALAMKGEVSDVEKELLSLLFLAAVRYDAVEQCELAKFNSVQLFRTIFCAENKDSCFYKDADSYSFKVMLVCLKQLLVSSSSANPVQTTQSVAFDLRFSTIALQHITLNLTWDSILRSTAVDSSLKLLSNLLLRIAGAAHLTCSKDFQAEYCYPFFSTLSGFLDALTQLFCSDMEVCDDTHMSKLSDMFDVLGDALSIITHSCSKFGLMDCYSVDIIELMDKAVVIYDIFNIDESEKLRMSKLYARYVFAFCTVKPKPPEYLANLLVPDPSDWSDATREASDFLCFEPSSYFLVTSCRHDTVDCYMQAVKAAAAQAEPEGQGQGQGQGRGEFVDNIIGGLRLILRDGNASESCQSVFSVMKLSIYSMFTWAVDLSSGQEGQTFGQYDADSIIKELKHNLISTNDKASSTKKNGKATTKSKTVSADDSEISTLMCKFKTSLLLLQWTFSTHARGDKVLVNEGSGGGGGSGSGSGSGGDDTAVGSATAVTTDVATADNTSETKVPAFHVVSAAFRLWEELLNLPYCDEKALPMLVDFFGDTYLLFFFLGLYGKVDEQVSVYDDGD
jgi:hypothetical protein